ncbi:MAG: hypothetical protein ACM4AI_06745 [Acidobacteriota bacterium]
MHVRNRPALLRISRVLIGAALTLALGRSSFAAEERSSPVRPREVPCASLVQPRAVVNSWFHDEPLCEARESAGSGEKDAAAQKEGSKRTAFLKWVHLDGLWIPPSNHVDQVGLIGTHLAIANIGRLYLYGPPGVMLIRQRNGGEWMFRPAFTWGFSFYLMDFRMPGSTQTMQLFANVTKVWTEGDERNGIDMVGLSVTWKK